MERKYSIGIALVGVYIILLGGYFFIHVVPATLNAFPNYINNNDLTLFEKVFGSLRGIIVVLAITGYFLSGAFLLLLKNRARIISIISSFFLFAEILWTGAEVGELNFASSIFYLIVFGLPTLFLIYPKIREQFK